MKNPQTVNLQKIDCNMFYFTSKLTQNFAI